MNNPDFSYIRLNLPEYQPRIKMDGEATLIFDSVRKKFVVLTPEEWVRQNFILYLHENKKYPLSLMAVEKKLFINGQPQRFDLLIYNRKGQPHLMAEFKAPGVAISQNTFDQVVRYNMVLKVETIVVSNGLEHYVCKIDYQNNGYSFLKEVPEFA
jgi:hypothetical protein